MGMTTIIIPRTLIPPAHLRKPKTSEYITYFTLQLTVRRLPIRFKKACRLKGRWINAAICFGIDLQDIFRLGIRHDLATSDSDGDGDDEIREMYVFLCVISCTVAH
jgi:hypothetical protein